MKTLSVNQMTTAEKLSAMEQLWDDLCHHAEDMQSPEGHNTILQSRKENIASGQSQFVDWEEAKSRIRNAVS